MLRKAQVQHIQLTPSKEIAGRVGFAALILLSISIVIVGQSENPTASRLRSSVLELFTPIISAASAPVDAISSAGNWLSEIANMRSENIALKNTNLELLKWQAVAKNLQAENDSLR